jgi:hypothetical protein
MAAGAVRRSRTTTEGELTMAVEAVKWLGRCDLCGEAAPEERDNFDEAQRDADECPCREGTSGEEA